MTAGSSRLRLWLCLGIGGGYEMRGDGEAGVRKAKLSSGDAKGGWMKRRKRYREKKHNERG